MPIAAYRGNYAMKTGEISEIHLAAVIAGATLLGGVLSSTFDAFLIDASTSRETDVQLVELAIGILSEPSPSEQAGEPTLRKWAVETINPVAEVKFDEEAKRQLVDGTVELPLSFIKALSPVSALMDKPVSPSEIVIDINGKSFRIQNDTVQEEPEAEQSRQ